MAGHQLGRGFRVLMFLETLGEHVFLLCRQHREFLDFGQISVEALLTAQRGDTRVLRFIHVFPNLSCVDSAAWYPCWASVCAAPRAPYKIGRASCGDRGCTN